MASESIYEAGVADLVLLLRKLSDLPASPYLWPGSGAPSSRERPESCIATLEFVAVQLLSGEVDITAGLSPPSCRLQWVASEYGA